MTYFYLLLSLLKKKLWKEFFETTVPDRLGKYEALLKSRDEGKGYFFGDKVSRTGYNKNSNNKLFLHNCKLLSISKTCTLPQHAYLKKRKKSMERVLKLQ